MNQEEINKHLLAAIDSEIEKLKSDYKKTISTRPEPTGTNAEIFEQVGRNVAFEINYNKQLEKLTKERNELTEPSAGVLEFLNQKQPVSKFDVDAGTAEIDEPDFIGKRI